MSTRWHNKPWDPEVVYIRRPTRYHAGWRLAAGRILIALATILLWLLMALLVWTQW